MSLYIPLPRDGKQTLPPLIEGYRLRSIEKALDPVAGLRVARWIGAISRAYHLSLYGVE
jgi:hypothetical protein